MKRIKRLVGIVLAVVTVMGSCFSVNAANDNRTYVRDECRSPLCYDSTHLENYHVYYLSTGIGSITTVKYPTGVCCR